VLSGELELATDLEQRRAAGDFCDEIGNSPIFPNSIFSPARTLTGNIALEIMAAMGTHRSALFATGNAFAQRDIEAAKRICAEDDEVDNLYDRG
jgi:hypothetical protein